MIFAFPGVIERWELIHAQALNKEHRMKQKLQQWQQFMSDLNNIMDWLGETEVELEQLRQLDVSTDIQTIEQRIKKLKVSSIISTMLLGKEIKMHKMFIVRYALLDYSLLSLFVYKL